MAGRQDAKIIVTGRATLNADVVAVGYRAHAAKAVGSAGADLAARGLDEVRAKLDALMNALNQGASRLADPQPVFTLTERVAGELERKRPDRLTLKALLTTIAEETRSVAEIAKAALALKDLVTGIF